MRFTHATTSCDEGFAGLSRLIQPYLHLDSQTHHLRNVLLDGTVQRRIADGNGRVVVGTHVQLVVILQQQRPFASVQFRSLVFRLDHILLFSRNSLFLCLFIYIKSQRADKAATLCHRKKRWRLSEKREKKPFRGYRVELGGVSFLSIPSALIETRVKMEVEKTVDENGER